ncbi:glutamate 5-kinase [Sandarakinorhabdus cyanobacteriorum]|uniref:Glutamate 5-kinase n=1 Tax=Sandarakinorhabdus cyanobacteriorum TaxID=1981098 RepID=A0A255YAB0_9SPHN|nr:glutamate 5-kinase [Sandarakinorhabdus cyanobacteriorum]OYQ26167.1 glutamate 5-kinase [Sandarakinorhabdus cyanobacteriorum]
MVAALTETPAAAFDPARCPRLVVKIGSSLLVDGAGQVREHWLAGVVADLAARRHAGQQIVIVSSGAIALGARRLGLDKGGRASLEDAQAAAAVGQVALAGVWQQLLGAAGLTAAQVLLTLGDLEDRRRYLNVAATIARLLDLGAVPVLNENDTVATAEIRYGDNDRLAARAAQAAGATGVILLSDVDGLYTANPASDPTAQRLPVVRALTPEVMAMATGETRSGMGSGGMAAKLLAARMAGAAGITLAICDGRVDRPLQHFAQSGGGTLFLPPRNARGRKAWLAGRITVAGTLQVDAGAAAALKRGASLLAAGVTGVDGKFRRGDVVAILGPAGELLGRGLAAYDAADAMAIRGRRNDDQAGVLGYAPRAALVHADHLVLI